MRNAANQLVPGLPDLLVVVAVIVALGLACISLAAISLWGAWQFGSSIAHGVRAVRP